MPCQPDTPFQDIPRLPPAVGDIVERNIAKRQTASVDLKQLVEIGVLEARQAGKEKLFINAPLMALIRDD